MESTNDIELAIIQNLITNEDYGRKVLPFLTDKYFDNNGCKTVFQIVERYCKQYNCFPSKQVLYIELQNIDGISQNQFEQTKQTIQQLNDSKEPNVQWLVDRTEKFCQDKALYNAIRQSISIIDSKTDVSKNSIPKIVQEALQVSFDSSIGHDLIDDSDARYQMYHKKDSRLEFDIDYLNKITCGGIPPKTLSCFIASTGVGKSLAMCHMAAANLINQNNVLYITLEMAEERIAQRIDSNLLDCRINELVELSKQEYLKRIDRIKQTTKGKLIIKEYPTATAGAAHFRHLLNELRIKKNFVPDVIYIDYLNLCISSRIKPGAQINTYSYIKSIAEELRGLAVEFNLPIFTATQSNRSGMVNSDIGLENTSDSIGLPMTVDFMVALISTEELEQLNQIMVKQLKNRFGDPAINRRFVIGVDKSKMRLYNIDDSGQKDILDGPVFDSTEFAEEEEQRSKRFNKSKFNNFH